MINYRNSYYKFNPGDKILRTGAVSTSAKWGKYIKQGEIYICHICRPHKVIVIIDEMEFTLSPENFELVKRGIIPINCKVI